MSEESTSILAVCPSFFETIVLEKPDRSNRIGKHEHSCACTADAEGRPSPKWIASSQCAGGLKLMSGTYDFQRRWMALREKPVMPRPVAQAVWISANSAGSPGRPAEPGASDESLSFTSRGSNGQDYLRRRQRGPLPFIAFSAAGLLVVAAIVVAQRSKPDSPRLSVTESTRPAVKESGSNVERPPVEAAVSDHRTAIDEQPAVANTERAVPADSARPPVEESNTGAAEQAAGPPTRDAPKDPPVTAGASEDRRLPIPDDDSQRSALKEAQDKLGPVIQQATTPGEKRTLARQLMRAGLETEDDPVTTFILLRVGRNLAMSSGDAALVMEIAETTSELYRVDALDMKAAELARTAKYLRTREDNRRFVRAGRAVIDDFALANQYDSALDLVEQVLVSARCSDDMAQVKEVVVRKKGLEAAAKAYAEVEQALDVLERFPDNPEANMTVGMYRCCEKGDWERGLAMLALGSDPDIRAAALKELMQPAEAEDQVQAGDAWWELAESQKGGAKTQMKQRATYWYRLALPRLNGSLEKIKVEGRLSPRRESKDRVTPPKKRRQPVVKPEWLVVFRSADPSIWNRRVNAGRNHMAVPLGEVPHDISYLRLAIGQNRYVIISISSPRLTARNEDSRINWNGTREFGHMAYALGIYDRRMSHRRPGDIHVRFGAPPEQYRGWGFGVRSYLDDQQGYCWNGEEIDQAVFEVAVKAGTLDASEKKHLLVAPR